LRHALEKGPVIATVKAGNEIFRNYQLGIIDSDNFSDLTCSSKFESHDFDHAVLIVGYGTMRVDQQPYVIIKNSFGKVWGQKGFAKISIQKKDGQEFGACGITQNMYQPLITLAKNTTE